MFRRLQSGLPQDPVYPATLKGLGYFINDEDEIRSIENPKAYFKYFLTKNVRFNDLQRESMNEAIRNIISDRIQDLGLEKVRLPLGAAANEPHLPIFVSKGLEKKKHVVVLFYENVQDIGVFAYRVIGGKGGINEGSAVNFVKHIQSQTFSTENMDSPGIILANTGQLRWWVRGQKAVTQTTWFALPQASAVEPPYRFNPSKNSIPGSTSTYEHISTIFNSVIPTLAHPMAQLYLIGVSDGAVQLSHFLNNPANFSLHGPRIAALATLDSYFHAHEIQNSALAIFLQNRGRAYVRSSEPAGTYICDAEGAKYFAANGCPTFSSGEHYYSEKMLISAGKVVVDWFKEVAADGEYGNPAFTRIEVGGESAEQEQEDEVESFSEKFEGSAVALGDGKSRFEEIE
ncbi:hypothetical protein QTJ16_000619 [Diplocarpon rosae]|uniref:Arb2 domain-containing protein n=1 Tax=Diplocarpon rosae TaxID=946125 RepID=A0AAD9T716_9HELO|nr:hypothetical protein QTJ16_000619 [Diplocarpon rosae]